jgi:flotillin
MSPLVVGGLIALAVLVGFGFLLSVMLRRVVPTNMVHVVQSSRKTVSYGKGHNAGNVYYEFPSWVPVLGVRVVKLQVSNFDLNLKGYEAYDKDRVPFVVDVTSFFRIEDTNIAAQRVSDMTELQSQLTEIVQGAVRKILASDVIDNIMVERSKFGDEFTDEVDEQLKQWGVKTVKSMELMDIRDAQDSRVIRNIMDKKMSHIEMESRTEVARNQQKAQEAEIAAKQSVDIRTQEAEQLVGQRTAEKNREVGIADEKARQKILEQQAETTERDMAVKKIAEVRNAEIQKAREVVAAEETKQTDILKAEGQLEAEKRRAEGIREVGNAEADAKKAFGLAEVEPQITLAQEIGDNEGYQQYLAMLEAIKGYMAVGSAQAEALKAADVKVIANSGSATEGATGAMNLFTSQGGTNMGAAIEAFAQTPLGADLINKLTKSTSGSQTPPTVGGGTEPANDDTQR